MSTIIPGFEKYLFRFVNYKGAEADEDYETLSVLAKERWEWLSTNFEEDKDFRIIKIFSIWYVAADSEELANILILKWNTRVIV